MNQQDTLTQLKRALTAIKELRAKLEAVEQSRHEPIAVIGMGCRLPDGIDTPAAFWQMLSQGVNAITESPSERWSADALYSTDLAEPGKMNTRWGGFLNSVEQFDAAFFGISPREATYMDPQQRLLLEVAYEALEDAGQTLQGVAGSQTGVFVGIHSQSSDYALMQMNDLRQITPGTATGTAHSIVANRLSYVFDLHGPSLAVDTACSSTLVAVHLACQSLRNQECDMALAGGVNMMLSPEATVAFSKLQMMARDGLCKVFDARADGFVRGEGCGLVTLKRLSDAQRDGDAILALIRGSAVNQDGRTNGLTAPNSKSQEAVIRQALRVSQVDPAQISFVETHGTGTALGDPIEVEALANTIGQVGAESCFLGSVKANIGHLEGAAGIAALLKVILALRHEFIPPQLHFQKLNPHISLAATRFIIPTQLQPWTSSANVRYAAISSFGFGGTNSHLIVSSVPDKETVAAASQQAADAQSLLLPLSAHTSNALLELAQRYRAFLAAGEVALPNICYSASLHRSHLEHRLALVGTTSKDFVEQLKAFVQAGGSTAVVAREQRSGILFVFSGQGTQWAGMGQELLANEATFRTIIEQIDALLAAEGTTWSLIEELAAPAEQSRLEETEIAQPAIFALQAALVALWRHWGIIPDAVVGHSVGEIAAAYVAGVLTLPEATRLAFHRGRIMQKATRLGKMAAIGLSKSKTEELLQAYVGSVAVAAINSPLSTVVAGQADALAELLSMVQEQGYFGRMLAVNYAFHTPQMEPLQRELSQVVTGLQPQPATIPIYSTVSGRLGGSSDFDAVYWGRNVREPVRFAAAIAAASADGYDTYLEVGPHPVLGVPIAQCMNTSESVLIAASLQRNEGERTSLLHSLGALHSWGYAVNWQALYAHNQRFVRLPSYPWQRNSYWLPRRERVRSQAVGSEQSQPSPAELPSSNQAWFYEVVWQWQALELTSTAPSNQGRWVILADQGGLGKQIAKQLEQMGQLCAMVTPGPTFARLADDHYQLDPTCPAEFIQLFQAIASPDGPPLCGILHLWSMNPGPLSESQVVQESSQAVVATSALHLLQALTTVVPVAAAGVDTHEPPKLWFVTERAQFTDSPTLIPATLWGLGRVISLEHPELWGGLIDLDSHSAIQAASWILCELLASGDEDQIAYRQGKRHVARFVSSSPTTTSADSVNIHSDGAYLVTGGLGELGLLVADWLVTLGARHLMLTSRTGLPERSRWDQADLDLNTRARIAAVRTLEARGAFVDIVAVDVADEVQMTTLFEWLGQQEQPLRGIIHAAGTVSIRPLVQLDTAELQAIMRPKVAGGWLLHQLSQTLPLDFFVLFSSGAAIWGSAGMGHYAAANHFLDALAHYRRSLGLHALSINWGWWRDGGMASAEIERSFASIGMQAMPGVDTLATLGQLLAADVAQKSVVAVDWSIFKPIYEAKRPRPFLAQIADQEATPEAATSAQMPLLRQRLSEAAMGERWEMLLTHVSAEAAAVLGYADSTLLDLHKGFFKMGMNSLMTVQLRSRLESSLGFSLPTTAAFEYPTIHALTSFLASELLRAGIAVERVERTPQANIAPEASTHLDAPTSLDSLTSEDLLAMFDDELAAVNTLVERNAE